MVCRLVFMLDIKDPVVLTFPGVIKLLVILLFILQPAVWALFLLWHPNRCNHFIVLSLHLVHW